MLKLTDAATGQTVFLNHMHIVSLNTDKPDSEATHITCIGVITYKVKETPEEIVTQMDNLYI